MLQKLAPPLAMDVLLPLARRMALLATKLNPACSSGALLGLANLRTDDPVLVQPLAGAAPC